MSNRHLFILAYDVVNKKRRSRALHVARSYATGGQKSVFECWLSEQERQQCLQRMSHILQANEDRLLLIRLDPRQRSYTLGLAVPAQDLGFFYQG